MTAIRFMFGQHPTITAGEARELAALLTAHGSAEENELAGKLRSPTASHDRLIAEIELVPSEMAELLAVLDAQPAHHQVVTDPLYRLRTELEAEISSN